MFKKWIAQNGLMVFVVLLTGLIAMGGEMAREWLRFDRQGIDHGQVWRVMSGNFTHLNTNHWLLNIIGWGLVWWLYQPLLSFWAWVGLLLWSSLIVGLGLYAFNVQLQYYVGLSGTLHGLFIAGAMLEIDHGWRVGGIILLGLFTAKLVYEQIVGSLPGTTQMSGGSVIVDAHLYGAISGLLLGLGLVYRARQRIQVLD